MTVFEVCGLTYTRVSHIFILQRLVPEIQDRILIMPKSVTPAYIFKWALRPIAPDGCTQRTTIPLKVRMPVRR